MPAFCLWAKQAGKDRVVGIVDHASGTALLQPAEEGKIWGIMQKMARVSVNFHKKRGVFSKMKARSAKAEELDQKNIRSNEAICSEPVFIIKVTKNFGKEH